MLGWRSQNPDLSFFNPELKRILRHRTPPMTMAEDFPTTKSKEYLTPFIYTSTSCIYIPNTGVNHYDIKSSVIQLLPSFYGLTNKDPYKHLDEFLEVCSIVKIQNFSKDALRLTLFPFPLKDKAKYWLETLSVTIQSWDQMQKEFLQKYFPTGQTNQMCRAITSFPKILVNYFMRHGKYLRTSWESVPSCRIQVTIDAVFLWQSIQIIPPNERRIVRRYIHD